MKTKETHPLPNEWSVLCTTVREHVLQERYDDCLPDICRAMEEHPHAPQPHNLLGILLEKKGDHAAAMKHFRAALALDPAYRPAGHNLMTYGTFFSSGHCAFDEHDIPSQQATDGTERVYRAQGVGYVAKHALSRVLGR